MRALLPAVLVALYLPAVAAPVRAALDPETGKPYHLRVVLDIADNRLLTKVFQEQVERELRDSLQAAFGDLATVEIVRQHARLKEVEKDGLLKALDAWKDVDDLKTHFVLIDYVNGEYEIQARQHDGLTGQASAVVRRERTSDRQFVARTAALLVGRDFGLVGTVTEKLDPSTVRVTFQGSGLGVPLERWLGKDEVLELVQIVQGSGGPRAARVPYALLRVEDVPANGVCTCQVFNRHPNPLGDGPGLLGYRCLKMSTTKAPLRLRLVQANARRLTPVPNQQVHIRHRSFQGENMGVIQGATDPDGFFSTDKDGDRGLFEHAAFVSVLNDNQLLVKIPIPIVDDRTVVVPVSISADENLQLIVRRNLWVSQTYESLLVLADLFKDLEALLKNKERDKALERARSGLQDVQEALARFAEQRGGLMKDAKSVKLELTEGDERLKELQKGQQKLQDFVARMEEALKKANDPKRGEMQAKVSQAHLLENEAEFQKAIDLYEEVLASGVDVDTAKLRDYVGKLKDAWKPKNIRQSRARTFIYETWPKLDALKLQDRLAEARDSFEACKAVNDTLTPQKLLKAAVAHAGRLKERLAQLEPDVVEDDRNTAKIIAETADGLNKLVRDVNAYLEKAAPRD